MANVEVLKCNQCGESKPLELMRKRKAGEIPTQCNACTLKVRKARAEKVKALVELAKVEPIKEDVPVKRTFQFTPYVPEKTWVRNNGNVHIPSRGYQC